MVYSKKCAVVGCEDEKSHRHRFPNPQKNSRLFWKWVEACQNPSLKGVSPTKIYNNYRVCHMHFREEDISTNMYLRKGVTIPTLNLPRQCATETILEEQTVPSTSSKTILEEQPIASTSSTALPSFEEPSTSAKVFQADSDVSSSSSKDQKVLWTRSPSGLILEDVGVTRQTELTPKAHRLYNRAVKLRRSVKQLKRRRLFMKEKYKIDARQVLEKEMSVLQPSVAKFIETQIRLANRSIQGRRFTIDDKIMGLILHKQSGKAYRTLSKLFCLPSKKTLMTLLQRIPIDAGINDAIFDNLKANVRQLKGRERSCIVLFDEVSLEPHIDVNIKSKGFDGFVHTGLHQSNVIADHALVFMIRGLSGRWKQPLMFTFCKGSTSAANLMAHIKTVISKCEEAGLTVVASVSDQGQTNVSAVNQLVEASGTDCRYSGYLKQYNVGRQKVVHIFDPPHLLKGIRNNLLTKHLYWETDDGLLCAKWEDIIMAYEADNTSGELRSMPKLTDAHVYANKMKKMKVACASQVFSHSVASFMAVLSRMPTSGVNGHGLLDTARILKFFDRLFDSVNASTLRNISGKEYKFAASMHSGHIQFWREARESLKKMYFQSEGSAKREVPPSLKNWISTLCGLEELVKSLKDLDFNFLLTRTINQDPLENFFCQIRQHGGRNANPTPTQFRQYFKTLLINNFSTPHSINANCEQDTSVNIVASVKQFVTQGVAEEIDSNININFEHFKIPDCNYSYLSKITLGYVSGYIIKKLKITCQHCKYDLICKDVISEWHDLTLEKEYVDKVPKKLKYCSPKFLRLLCQCYSIIMHCLPHVCHLPSCIEKLIQFLESKCYFDSSCNEHVQLKQQIIRKFTMLCAHNWANGVNRYLCGKTVKPVHDPILAQAKNYYCLRRKNK